jgi:hypothetical protein
MSKFSSLVFLFLTGCLVIQLSACGKKGTPEAPEDCGFETVTMPPNNCVVTPPPVPPAYCDFNSFPDTTTEMPNKPCLPDKFPAIYPPDDCDDQSQNEDWNF